MACMGTSVRYRKDRGWSVRIFYKGKRQEVGRFGHDDEAKVAAETLARELAEAHRSAERWEHPRPGMPLPIAGLVRDWEAIHGPLRSERTQLTDHGRVERLAGYFGGRDARSLTLGELTAFATTTMETRSAWVAIGCLSTLRRVLNLAAEAGLLERPSVHHIAGVIRACRQRGASEETRPDAWSREEVATLLELAARHEPHFEPALRFAFATGARRGELLALRWEDVDFSRSRVHIRRTARVRGRGTKPPKVGRGRFTPLAPAVCDALADHRERQRRAVWTTRALPEWVFPSPKGRFWQERNFSRAWERLRRRAAERGVRPLPLHATRHTFATWALEAGTPAKRVAEWIGCSVAVLERHYSHVLPTGDTDLSFLGEIAGGAAVGRSGAAARRRRRK